MDRLNQLRGDAGASRDSTLDTSSLLGEAYMTANDSSKYFSLSEVDSNPTVQLPKDEASDVTADSSISHAERIISDLSPIPKKSELDSFKIGDQIEAANILSGGVNIFDDNENSYDGDELVIDDAVAEGDDKPAEIKLDLNEETFEKTDRLADTLEDAEAAIPIKDTEVVLQIDGNNVDAIDIGNGLYLYRKDGEEELAAVQILHDNEQPPDIKFLKVRENAEGNLEVYEEIEIEVPKEVPTKEGMAFKNTTQIPFKEISKDIEPINNRLTETRNQAVPKDTSTCEVELDVNKDNAHLESRTELNLNGKMMKFSESRKSPVIGTFTPMTYHSTPNKEGIPLTKTMVDLQLHPNRHSENVKKTIEVHTDNCKQRLLETPVKNNKDSNEYSKSLVPISSSDKDIQNNMIVDGADHTRHENDKDINQTLHKNKTDEVIPMKLNDGEKIENFEYNVNDEKTDNSAIKIPNTAVPKPSLSPDEPCLLNIKPLNEGDNVLLIPKRPLSETCSKINTDICALQAHDKVNDGLHTEIVEGIHSEGIKSKNITVYDDITTGNNTIVNTQENKNICNDDDIIQIKEKNFEKIDNPNISDVITNNEVSHTNTLENHLKTTQNQNDSTERNKYAKLPQKDFDIKDMINIKEHGNNSEETLEISPKLKSNQEINKINKTIETLNTLPKHVSINPDIETKDSETLFMEKSKSTSYDSEEIINNPKKINPFQEKSVPVNLKPAEMKRDSSLSQPEPSVNVLDNLPKDKSSELKQQDKDCKITVPETKERESNTESKPFKHKNKLFTVDSPSSKSLKVDNISYVKNNEFEKKNKAGNMSKGLVEKVDIKSNEQEIISSKEDKHTSNCTPNEDKALHKNSITIDQSCSRNSSLIMKVDIQKKNETKQKLPIIYKSTKIALLTSDLKLPHTSQNVFNEAEKSKNDTKKEHGKVSKVSIPKPTTNNKAAVPFGMWTEANRQEFLNKIKESKAPMNTSNTKQLKQPNDLNRRDILQKIDSQRQSNIASTKIQELNILNKIKLKHETTAFTSKSNVTQKEKMKDSKISALISKAEQSVSVIPIENTSALDNQVNKEHQLTNVPVDMSSTAFSNKKDSVERKEINNQDLIDKTIEGIINRAVTAKLGQEDKKLDTEPLEKPYNVTSYTPVSLDEIESKMNELHGIPFVERPPHELPKVFEHDNKSVTTPDLLTVNKGSKLSSDMTFTNKSEEKNKHRNNQPVITPINEESDEEVIEHEPITGDIELNKNILLVQGPTKGKIHTQEPIATKLNCDSKKETIITENDFDKFARRNSITYENCLTVNFDGKEHHNVVQTVVEREAVPKKLSRNEIMLAESKAKSHKQLGVRHINFASKIPTATKTTQEEESYNKSYQSKVQLAYQTVMTAKRQQECPITIIEDKPVKVVFMDGNHEYIPHHLNVQGKELSPPKKSITEWDHFAHSNSESLDSDILDSANDSKSQDDIKFKSKHQRKQVLTPVEAPELELIEPGDIGIEVSPKKKRKIEDNKSEKTSKTLVPKKSYLLNRNITTDDALSNSQDSALSKESVNKQDIFMKHTDPISAIDNLVKAAELLETQSESKHGLPLTDHKSLVQPNSPVKRGRGRPRKYPLPEQGSDNKNSTSVKTPTAQKKPRLIDPKDPNHNTESEDDEINSDGELVKENWTMGKINENIVCPICNKLFRSENVVFKHVKHCTGPSPSRSDSDKRSPGRMRQSQEVDWKSEGSKSDSMDIDEDYKISKPTKKRKSKEKRSSSDDQSDDITDVIVIEDSPIKDRDSPIRKRLRLKNDSNITMVKPKVQHGISNLVCEFCGKTFRQLSYLVNHRLQHKNTETKKSEKDHVHKSLFSCEICKKEFRKLHHLVQHRIIHNSNSIRTLRKSSLEQNDNKPTKEGARPTEDQSAGFRCEPCDKSFRKLHHLVEHRETHDEINKKCNPVTSSAVDTTKPTLLHHCDICKKTFKKLQHLIEHKEHHLETSSEKSDDKSVKSSLSTKDIIHECPLCYMVFPNEHSLNKHHIICQRKKKQTAAKHAKQVDENDTNDVDDGKADDENQSILDQKTDADMSCVVIEDEILVVTENQENNLIEIAKPLDLKKEVELVDKVKPIELEEAVKPEIEIKSQINENHTKSTNKKDEYDRNTEKILGKSKRIVVPATTLIENIKVSDTTIPKKKLLAKDKIGATVTKRQKTTDASMPVVDKVNTPDSSDDDEIRYMLNPDFPIDESNEGKLFMKVRAKKRNSLQIERPNSKDLMKRRISLQHPPKIPRLKVKPIPRKPTNTNTIIKSTRSTAVPAEPPPSTDSDDGDVKYSFPEPVMKKIEKEAQKKVKKQKMEQKRKSLSNIAKRKSLGKIISITKNVNQSPVKQIKRRTADAEHRCDCGQLFSSAALLMRHTSLAHTPPRIRRRRSPPPDSDAKPTAKRTEKSQDLRKTIVPASLKTGVTTRKSNINSELKPATEVRKTPKTASLTKTLRNKPHKGVPVPEKMRKLMDKSKK